VANVIAAVGIAACVGVVAVGWVAGALYNAFRFPHSASHVARERPRSEPSLTVGDARLIGLAVVCVGLAIVGRRYFDDLAVGAFWVRFLGLSVLVASTVFTLWARFSLGTMWSVGPRITGGGQLRTRGPYAVTRHPIYSGMLGMLLGTTLLSGIGQ
jgi:deazaflavin-dependent oxidoreductase (nitroreductase family)